MLSLVNLHTPKRVTPFDSPTPIFISDRTNLIFTSRQLTISFEMLFSILECNVRFVVVIACASNPCSKSHVVLLHLHGFLWGFIGDIHKIFIH